MPKWNKIIACPLNEIDRDLLISVLFYHEFDKEFEKWMRTFKPPAGQTSKELTQLEVYEFALLSELRRARDTLWKYSLT